MAVQDYGTEGNRRFFKINAKECKLFENVKTDDKREDVPRKNVEGKFVKIELTKKEYEGKQTEFIKLILKDGDEVYEIGTSRSSLGQQLINSLAGEVRKKKLGNIAVGVWSKTVDGKEYPRLSIHNNADTTEWLYGIEQQKEMIEIVKNKKGEFVSRDVSTYVDKLRDQIAIINENNPEDGVFGEDEEEPVVEKTKKKAEDDDFSSLPF